MFVLMMKAARLLILLLSMISVVHGCIGGSSVCSSKRTGEQGSFDLKPALKLYMSELLCSFEAIHGWEWNAEPTHEILSRLPTGDGKHECTAQPIAEIFSGLASVDLHGMQPETRAWKIMNELPYLLNRLHEWGPADFGNCSEEVVDRRQAKANLKRFHCLFPVIHKNWDMATGGKEMLVDLKKRSKELMDELDLILNMLHCWDTTYFGQCPESTNLAAWLDIPDTT